MVRDVPEITTDRLNLVSIHKKYISDYFKNVLSRPETFTYFDKYPLEDERQAREKFEKWMSRYYEHPYQWMLLDRRSGRPIGKIDLHNYKEGYYHGELGWQLSPFYWGNGLMTEAVMAVLDLLWRDTNLHIVSAVIHEKNRKSIELAARCGFMFEAVLHERQRDKNGAFNDALVYYITQDMFEKCKAETNKKYA